MQAVIHDMCKDITANEEMAQKQIRANPVPLMAWLILLVQPVSHRLQGGENGFPATTPGAVGGLSSYERTYLHSLQ